MMTSAPESEDEFRLDGKVVVLTGGAGILGARMACALSARGAQVVLIDRDEQRAQSVAREAKAHAFGVDITSLGELKSLKQHVERTLGTINVLINNAAAKSQNFFAPFEEFPLQDWDEVIGINLTGAMLASQIFGSEMARRGSGSIVNILSIYGIVAPDQRIYEGSEYEGHAINTPAVYSASKAGLWGLTKYLASYWGHRNVRVNAITPGGVFSGQNDTFVARYSARVPLGRMARRDELCGALIFLASEASSYITGQNLVVDGGLTVW